MFLKKKLFSYKIIILLLYILSSQQYPQNNFINWFSFNNGFGVSGNAGTKLESVIGQTINGKSGNGTTSITAGFFTNSGLSGPPSNTGTFSVTTISDTGLGSLRRAIDSANTKEGLNIISFNIPGNEVHTITPLTPLPMIMDPVIIDGYTQPGSTVNTNTPGQGNNANLLIEINGANTSGGNYQAVFNLGVGSCTIRGLVINNSPGAAIGIYFSSQELSNIIIEGNYIGTNPSGTQSVPNQYGIQIESCRGVLIGGSTPASQNVISGNTLNGIGIGTLSAGGRDHVIKGNFLGTNASGTSAIGNGTGIRLAYQTRNVFVGGTVPEERNIISGNLQRGIMCDGGSPVFPPQVIKGNFIGTDVTGTQALGNGDNGVYIYQYGTKVGGSEKGAGNLISGNGNNGILLQRDSVMVMGNSIGTDTSGTGAIGNSKSGIKIESNENIIGGNEIGERNIVAFNGTSDPNYPGILIISSYKNNKISGNSIHSNKGLGIDLSNSSGPDGTTINDQCDDDIGSNNLQNFPVITSVMNEGSNVRIEGMLNSKTNSSYRIEFFSSEKMDSSLNVEGKNYLGFTDVTTDGNCNTSFSVEIPVNIPPGYYITATATDEKNNTSEFSSTVQVALDVQDIQPPGEYAIYQNYPNPFNPSTIIKWQIPLSGFVSLKIYDVLGNEITTLVNEYKIAGYYENTFDASNLSSGLYLYRLVSGNYISTKKMLMIK